MSVTLAIETSSRTGSVALFDGASLLAESVLPPTHRHAADLLPMIDGLCREHRLAPADLKRIAVSIGPGSFTGLRVGITLAKTLAFATGAQLIPVPTTAVIIRNLPPAAEHGVIVLDAKREQIFTARYARVAGEWIEQEAAHLDTLAGAVGRAPRPVYLIGEGIPYHRKHLPTPLPADIIEAEESTWTPRAAVVGELSLMLPTISPRDLTPLYLRRPEPEEKWLAAQGKLGQ